MKRHGILFEIRWWSRYAVRYWPRNVWRRLTDCREQHVGPLYDGECCLHCGKAL